MKLAAICCTYKRPRDLGNAIACFCEQRYPADRIEMIVLDDAGQYDECTINGNIHIVSTRRRFRTLGEKRNASAGLVSDDVEAYLVWDDDDAYLPWHAAVVEEALRTNDLVRPKYVLTQNAGQRFGRRKGEGLFHGGWGVRRDAFDMVGGYPHMQSGQDQGLSKRLLTAPSVRSAFYDTPGYIYRWNVEPPAIIDGVNNGEYHISAMGARGYERLAERTSARVGQPPIAVSCDWSAKIDALLRAEDRDVIERVYNRAKECAQ